MKVTWYTYLKTFLIDKELDVRRASLHNRSTTYHASVSTMAVILGKHVTDTKSIINRLVFACYRDGLQGEFTNDVGWGCTIRSTQMLLANAILQEKTDLSPVTAKVCNEIVKDNIHDDTNLESPFSIQNIVDCGISYGIVPKQWFTPSQGAKCISDISKKLRDDWLPFSIAVYGSQATGTFCYPALIMAPIRFGNDRLNSIYEPVIASMIQDKRFRGLICGKGNSSYFVCGIEKKDNYVIYLDPHEMRTVSDRNYMPSTFNHTSIEKLQPTMCVAFAAANETDLQSLVSSYPDVFLPLDQVADYDVSIVEDDDGFCILH